MQKQESILKELDQELQLLGNEYSHLKKDALFVAWFLTAYVVGDMKDAINALTGKTGGKLGEKGIDAVHVDHLAKQCYIVQGKYRTSLGKPEKRNDVMDLAHVARAIYDPAMYKDFIIGLAPIVERKLKEVRHKVVKDGYSLRLYYATTGTCSSGIEEDAVRYASKTGNSKYEVVQWSRLRTVFRDYSEGVVPVVPEIRLHCHNSSESKLYRYDEETGIESWVVTVSGHNIGRICELMGPKLFAKNIRGYLDQTRINGSISSTIDNEPENFWYYNNGITIVCDGAKEDKDSGRPVLVLDGAQIINGQQTARTLAKSKPKDVDVLVKVIRVPRTDLQKYDSLVNAIVRAANWQNHINSSDLVSNDSIQIHLEKEMRKHNYQYIRKRMSKSEASAFCGQGCLQINKSEVAQAVGGCFLDPATVRKGKEKLFEDPHYKKVFDSRDVWDYLVKYWLLRSIKYKAKGHPKRAYTTWLVLNFVWAQVRSELRGDSVKRSFERLCRSRAGFPALYRMIEEVYRAAISFYNENSGKGEEQKDISAFFQLQGQHLDFINHWKSKGNKIVRDRFKKSFGDFVRELKDS